MPRLLGFLFVASGIILAGLAASAVAQATQWDQCQVQHRYRTGNQNWTQRWEDGGNIPGACASLVRTATVTPLVPLTPTPVFTVPPTPTPEPPAPTPISTTAPVAARPTNTLGPTHTPPATATPETAQVPSGNTRIVPDQYPSISAASAAANPGDVVRVRTGVYGETVALVNHGVTVEPFGDGPVWIDGGCIREGAVMVGADDVTVRGLGLRNTTVHGIYVNGRDFRSPPPARGTITENTIIDWDCKGVGTIEAFAGIYVHYAGPGWTVTDNFIQRRVSVPGPQAGGGNGILFHSNDQYPSGGGHTITGNRVIGGRDCIGGQNEDFVAGSFHQYTLIAYNHVEQCHDDGIQVEGGNHLVVVEHNQIFDSQGIGLAPNLVGPLTIRNNYVQNGRDGAGKVGVYGNMYCFKVGNHGLGYAHISDNICDMRNGTNTVGTLIEADVMSQTNPGLQGFFLERNVLIGGRYVLEFTGGPLPGSFFADTCHYSSRNDTVYKYANQRYWTLAEVQQATGHGFTAQWGGCTYTAPAPLPIPPRVPDLGPLPSATPTATRTATPLPTATFTPQPGMGTLFLFDSMTGPDGQYLSNPPGAGEAVHRAEVGGGWVRHPRSDGRAQLSGNMAMQSGAGALMLTSALPATAEYDVEAVIVWPGGSDDTWSGPVGRADPSVDTGYWVYSNGSRWTLQRAQNGVWTELGSAPGTLTAGQSYTVRLQLRNAAKVVLVNGTEVIRSQDNSITGIGGAGFSVYHPSLRVDSVSATNAAP